MKRNEKIEQSESKMQSSTDVLIEVLNIQTWPVKIVTNDKHNKK